MRKTLLTLTITGMGLLNSNCTMKMGDEKHNEKYTIDGSEITYTETSFPYKDKDVCEIREKTKNTTINYHVEGEYYLNFQEYRVKKHFEKNGIKYSNPKDSVYQILEKRFDSIYEKILKQRREKAIKEKQKKDFIQKGKNKN